MRAQAVAAAKTRRATELPATPIPERAIPPAPTAPPTPQRPTPFGIEAAAATLTPPHVVLVNKKGEATMVEQPSAWSAPDGIGPALDAIGSVWTPGPALPGGWVVYRTPLADLVKAVARLTRAAAADVIERLTKARAASVLNSAAAQRSINRGDPVGPAKPARPVAPVTRIRPVGRGGPSGLGD